MPHTNQGSAAHDTGQNAGLFEATRWSISAWRTGNTYSFIGVNVGGAVGWSLGEMVGTTTAFLASGVGSVLGAYVGWRVENKLLN